MEFNVLTLFPEMIDSGLNHSIIKRAINENIIKINSINIRDFAFNKHNQVDDYPYGGGAGMVMACLPVYRAYQSIGKNTRVVYMTPQGKTFNQKMAEEFSKEQSLTILCGHYEGIDQRVIDEIVTDEVSIGDYILSGGEIPAMAIIDAVSRLVPGVLNKEESYMYESFTDNLLEYPQYTRPVEFMGKMVPDVLLSGHHKNIELWRRKQAIINTILKRPELLDSANLTEEEKNFILRYKEELK